MEGQFGLRWREFSRRGRGPLETKEKWFPSDDKRAAFAEAVAERDGFYEFVAWCDKETLQ